MGSERQAKLRGPHKLERGIRTPRHLRSQRSTGMGSGKATHIRELPQAKERLLKN